MINLISATMFTANSARIIEIVERPNFISELKSEVLRIEIKYEIIENKHNYLKNLEKHHLTHSSDLNSFKTSNNDKKELMVLIDSVINSFTDLIYGIKYLITINPIGYEDRRRHLSRDELQSYLGQVQVLYDKLIDINSKLNTLN